MERIVIRGIIEKYKIEFYKWNKSESLAGVDKANIASDIANTAIELLSLLEEFDNL